MKRLPAGEEVAVALASQLLLDHGGEAAQQRGGLLLLRAASGCRARGRAASSTRRPASPDGRAAGVGQRDQHGAAVVLGRAPRHAPVAHQRVEHPGGGRGRDAGADGQLGDGQLAAVAQRLEQLVLGERQARRPRAAPSARPRARRVARVKSSHAVVKSVAVRTDMHEKLSETIIS